MHDYLVEMFIHTPQSRDERAMTPAGDLLAAEIRRDGPIPFRRFMEVALYHPEHGYYRRPRDPFGKAGDFFTAEQIQPVFGILMAARMRQLYRAMGEPADFTVVELGAGRGEMADAFARVALCSRRDLDSGELPGAFRRRGLRQRILRRAAGGCRGVCAAASSASSAWRWPDDRFVWSEGGAVAPRSGAITCAATFRRRKKAAGTKST